MLIGLLTYWYFIQHVSKTTVLFMSKLKTKSITRLLDNINLTKVIYKNGKIDDSGNNKIIKIVNI